MPEKCLEVGTWRRTGPMAVNLQNEERLYRTLVFKSDLRHFCVLPGGFRVRMKVMRPNILSFCGFP
jgi:hypothetical protein